MHLSSLHFRLLPVFVLLVGSMAGMAQQALSISDRRELFVDDYLIDSLKTAELRMHSPVDEGEVLLFNLPWEGAFSAYVTILQDEDIYKAYYRGVPTAGNDGNSSEVTCYATSRDGIHWEKPHLGIHEIMGNKNNNIILADAAPFTHNFSPFIDRNPAAKPEERFKALGGTSKSGLVAFVSPDGVHWKKCRRRRFLLRVRSIHKMWLFGRRVKTSTFVISDPGPVTGTRGFAPSVAPLPPISSTGRIPNPWGLVTGPTNTCIHSRPVPIFGRPIFTWPSVPGLCPTVK